MKTEFKNIAHLYLGCAYQEESGDLTTLTGVESDGTIRLEGDIDYFPFDGKPILRPLISMTEHECDTTVYKRFTEGEQADDFYLDFDSLNPVQFSFLLSRNFDLFGLIESGQAIDATTLNTNPYE